MKKLFVLIALIAGTANAGLIDSAMTQGWQTKETKKYKLDMYGFDARAYEFKTDNGMTCVAVFPGGSAVGWQMQCMPTK
jgi:hypothetical protein